MHTRPGWDILRMLQTCLRAPIQFPNQVTMNARSQEQRI
jgi:hypothetical protein